MTLKSFSSSFLLLLLFLSQFHLYGLFNVEDCDHVFDAKGGKQGMLKTPNYPENYPNNMQCLYWFVAEPDEKVWITFKDFAYGGNMPECLHAYIDIYLQLNDTRVDLIDQYLDKRICGSDRPLDIMSLHNIIVLGLYSDSHPTAQGFTAQYQFIKADKYNIGIRDPKNFCGFTVNAKALPSGTIMSPTYPSVLTTGLSCYWKFVGLPGQRIRLNFTVINIEHGGDHCPYDAIQIYDGKSVNSLHLATVCGEKTGKVLYSSSKNALIKFTTKESERLTKTGFEMNFAFESNIVNLNFISNPGYHILGTECDQQVLSLGETNGTMYSPMYPQPYKKNLECLYFLKGLKDRENLEKVSIIFQHFDVPNELPKCADAYIGIYFKLRDSYDLIPPDVKYCNAQPPGIISSVGHLLIIKFKSGNVTGKGFKIWYDFDTDFGIPGTPHPEKSKCDFTFMSESQKSGGFNSPRHPANYPLKSSCIYLFKAMPGEIIKLNFEHFMLPQIASPLGVSPEHMDDEERCALDYVKIYNVWSEEREDLLGTFCGQRSPFPIESEPGLSSIKVIFQSGSNETNDGFACHYSFVPLAEAKSNAECSHNMTKGTAMSGLVKTPNYPYKYQVSLTCDWFIAVKPANKILLTLLNFNLEGMLETGCSGAALLVWTNLTAPPKYLCGSMPASANQSEFLSAQNVMRVRFISSKRATGSKGFRASWTQIIYSDPPTCEKGFMCQSSNYCIDSTLKCNHIRNCGSQDDSDEKHCFGKKRKSVALSAFCVNVKLLLTIAIVVVLDVVY